MVSLFCQQRITKIRPQILGAVTLANNVTLKLGARLEELFFVVVGFVLYLFKCWLSKVHTQTQGKIDKKKSFILGKSWHAQRPFVAWHVR